MASASDNEPSTPKVPVNKEWIAKKTSILERFKQPNGYELVTSFTDKQPLHGWTAEHAIRELWQNFKDGLRKTFGAVKFSRLEGSPNFYVGKDSTGQIVGNVNCTELNQLVITQDQSILTIENLQLASVKQNDRDIGGHGEGFKLGINILLRQGYHVRYLMPQQDWIFELHERYAPGMRNMTVQFNNAIDRDELIIVIEGPEASKLFNPLIDLDLVPYKYSLCQSKKYGSVYSSSPPVSIISTIANNDANNAANSAANIENNNNNNDLVSPIAGFIYCRGLLVGVDEDLKNFKLVVNLEHQPSRDRHMVPAVLWRQLQRLLEEKARSEQDREVFDYIMNLARAKPAIDVTVLVPYVKTALRHYLADLYGVPSPNQIVLLKDVNEKLSNILSSLDMRAIPSMGAFADPINIEELRKEYLARQPILSLATDFTPNEQRYLQSLQQCLSAIELSVHKGFQLVFKNVPEMGEYTPILVENFTVIIFDRQHHLQDETSLFCAAQMMMNIINNLTHQNYRRALARLIVDYMRKPFEFQVKKYHQNQLSNNLHDMFNQAAAGEENGKQPALPPPPPPPHQTESSDRAGINAGTMEGGQGNNNNNNNMDVDNDHESAYVPGNSRIPNSIRESNFTGVNDVGTINQNDGIERCACTSYKIGSLELQEWRSEIVYVDQEHMQYYETNREMIHETFPLFHSAVNDLVPKIANQLEIPITKFYILYAAFNRQLLGVNQGGGIYINTPLFLRMPPDVMRRQIFLTILHELTHRHCQAHNSEFADTFSNLVLECRRIF
jgi:predicted metal-dependent hydrolase